MDVVFSVAADGWDKWGERYVKRQPLSRVQHTISGSPSVDQVKIALKRAIAVAGADGRLIVNVGHGGTVANDPLAGFFDLAPNRVMRIGGHDLANVFVDVFYDVNLAGPPAMSDMENDLKFNPSSPRLARWRVYQEIAQAFRAARVREVVLLTCRVGNSTEFLRKVANDWGLIVTAYRQRVALLEDVTRFGTHVTRRFLLYLVNNPPPYRTAAETILHEEEIPYAPGDTYRVGPPLP